MLAQLNQAIFACSVLVALSKPDGGRLLQQSAHEQYRFIGDLSNGEDSSELFVPVSDSLTFRDDRIISLSRNKRQRRNAERAEGSRNGDEHLSALFPATSHSTATTTKKENEFKPIRPSTQIVKENYQYYNVSLFYPPSEQLLAKHWIDIEQLSSSDNISVNLIHPLLSNSYRRAAEVLLRFDYPFYGRNVRNVKITTGGFLSVGPSRPSHGYLAATYYVAPLMANFGTAFDSESNIRWADLGEFAVFEWHRVRLRDNPAGGEFTFQVVLHKNGDIYFLYKNVPLAAELISSASHPTRAGLSDAYSINHKIDGSPFHTRIIYEYHQIRIDLNIIRNNTVILLEALPACISARDPKECASIANPAFQCTWCSPRRSDGSENAFCSDSRGINSRRQDWLDNRCDEKPKPNADTALARTSKRAARKFLTSTTKTPTELPMQKAEMAKPANVDVATRLTNNAQAQPTASLPVERVKLSRKGPSAKTSHRFEPQPAADSKKTALNLGLIVSASLAALTCFVLIGWLIHAYYTPRSLLGQQLIRHRPTAWRNNNDNDDESEVTYTHKMT